MRTAYAWAIWKQSSGETTDLKSLNLQLESWSTCCNTNWPIRESAVTEIRGYRPTMAKYLAQIRGATFQINSLQIS